MVGTMWLGHTYKHFTTIAKELDKNKDEAYILYSRCIIDRSFLWQW